jgi:hypothetical protein
VEKVAVGLLEEGDLFLEAAFVELLALETR